MNYRLLTGFATAAALAASLVLLTPHLFFRNANAQPLCHKPTPTGPSMNAAATVAGRFVQEGVVRTNPICAWYLSTPNLRGPDDEGPSSWANGDIPVVPFVTHQPHHIQIRVRPIQITNVRIVAIFAMRAPDAQAAEWMIVLVHTPNGWRVDYCAPNVTRGMPQ